VDGLGLVDTKKEFVALGECDGERLRLGPIGCFDAIVLAARRECGRDEQCG
jgi:hypothetical protein